MFGRLFSMFWRRRKEEEIYNNENNQGINLKELEYYDSENDQKRKLCSSRKRNFGSASVKSEPNTGQEYFDSSEEETEYDIKRKKVIEEREQMLRNIGVMTAKEELTVVIHKIRERNNVRREAMKPYAIPTRKLLPLRSSLRLKGKEPERVAVKIESTRSFIIISPRKPTDAIELKFFDGDSATISNNYLQDLKPHLSHKLSGSVLETDDLGSFKSRVQELKLSPSRIQKVVMGRVTAAAVHPSESKLLVAAGDTFGNLGFWDVKTKNTSIMFQPHYKCVRHASFSIYSLEKLISTSMDGTVRCGDLNEEVFTQIYRSDEDTYGHHTYWHAEMNREVLLIAHGSGEVGVFDQRQGKLSHKYKCHNRSVRTVQCHPVAENYFVTSSGKGEARIWDVRHIQKLKPKPLIDLEHPKMLTACFFSPAGNYLLTTCSDASVRVYDTRNFKSEFPKVVMNISHHEKGHRTLKAKWHPQREDAFVIGSMMRPGRAHVYGVHGNILHDFMNPELQGALPECEFHPTQLAFVGGSHTGRIHVFL